MLKKIISEEKVVCPNCKGDGEVRERTSPYDSEYIECTFCNGKKILIRRTTVEYIKES